MRVLLLFLVFAVGLWGQVSGGVIAVRDSGTGAIVPQIGDTANSAMRVNVVAGSGAGVSHVDDALFTVTTDDIVPAGAMFDDTTPDSVDEDDAGVVRMSANRNLYTTLRDAAGNERGVNVDATNRLSTSVDNSPTLGANSGVDIGDVDVTSVIPLTGATNLGKAVDVLAGGSDVGVAMLGVRDDALGGITPAAGDYTTLLVDANGALWTRDDVLDATVAGNEQQVDVVAALPAGTNLLGIVETIPDNSCGTTLQDTEQADVATGAGSTIEASTTCVDMIHVSNVTASPCTITIEDGAGTPFEYVEAFTVAGNSTARWDFDGMSFTSGITAIAGTASCINLRMKGWQ
jgi:hypothetical protein